MASERSNEIDRSKLLNAMTNAFSEGELRTLCFELDIDYEDLSPGGKSDMARELILACERTGRLDDLLSLCQQKRPRIGWAAARQPTSPAGDPGPVVRQEPADIFLSYSRKDSAIKDRLAQDLRQAGLSVWTDNGLEPGTSSWHKAIESQLETAGCLVVLLSPDAKRSIWVRRELDYGAAQGKHVFPVMIRGTRNNAIPITIIDAQFVDLRQEYATNFVKLRNALQRHLSRIPAGPTTAETPPVEPDDEGGPVGLTVPPDGVAIPHIVTGASPLNIEWCWVPAGPFTMGSNEYDSEKPAHTVDLAGFWLARYPVTNAQYRLFIEAGGYDQARWWSETGWQWRKEEDVQQPWYWTDSMWNGDQQPVVGVCWYEAIAFARWAAEATGEPIRLPTEAEWEKAARGTDGRAYPWGNDAPSSKLGNFNRNVGKTTSVGQYSPGGDGPFGNADLSGNVWEWLSSRLWTYPYKAEDDREDLASEHWRVVRGGSWLDPQDRARAAYRYRDRPYGRNFKYGFRVVRRPPI